MLHAVFIAICVVAVVFFPICIHGLVVDLRKQKGLNGGLTRESHKHQHASSPEFHPPLECPLARAIVGGDRSMSDGLIASTINPLLCCPQPVIAVTAEMSASC
jgi:hypothetical protein